MRARWSVLGVAGLLAVLAALLAVAASCGGGGTSSSTTGASPAAAGSPVAGGDVVFARTGDVLSPDPTAIADNLSIWVEEQIFQTLYTVNDNGIGVHPTLVTGYTLSSDKLTWTFQLKPGITFSDGKSLTAQDVAFSLNRARKSTRGLGYIDSAIKDVEAQGTSTVVVTTKYPWAPLIADLSLFTNGIYPADFGGKSEAAFFAHPIGTGPFLLRLVEEGPVVQGRAQPQLLEPGSPTSTA